MSAPARRAVALIGDPVAHSVSPLIHRAGFEAVGLELDYVPVRVRKEDLADAFPLLRRTYLGLNVTTPLKEAVAPLLDTLSPTAARAGSVNTVLFSKGRAAGTSTDGEGFIAALRTGSQSDSGELPSQALILGTGGAARAVACALRMNGTRVTVCGRNAETGGRMASHLGVRFVSPEREVVAREVARADLLVNATPVGGAADPGACPLPRSVSLRPGLVVFDLVYRPRRTALLAMAEAAGCRTVEGIEMLVEQAARSFETWTGRPAPTQVMRVAGYRALEDPPAPGRLVGRSDLPSSIAQEAG